MPKPLLADRYTELIERAEAQYQRRGFAKWADLAHELGVSRQCVQQMMQRAVEHRLITTEDLDRYRSPDSRRALARTNEALRREQEKHRITLTLLPDNHAWLECKLAASSQGTTRSDLINAALTHYRNNINA
jgi:Mn-dependent DtxR family transcriptional regulator